MPAEIRTDSTRPKADEPPVLPGHLSVVAYLRGWSIIPVGVGVLLVYAGA